MMWKWMGAAAAAPVAIIALASCQAPQSLEECTMNYTNVGVGVGAIAGAGAGAGIAAIANASGGGIAAAAIGGAVVGGIAGYMVGQQRDQACHKLAMKRALDDAAAADAARQAAAAAAPPPPPAYKPVGWSNTKTGNSGTITPVAQTAGATAGAVCMDYVDQQIVNGQAQRVTAKACRTPDGEWKPVT